MPLYNIAQAYEQGVSATNALDRASAERQALQLQQQYAPEAARLDMANKQALEQSNMLKLQSLVRSAQSDDTVRPIIQKLASDPSFSALPPSEQSKKLAAIYAQNGNPDKAAEYNDRATRESSSEALVEERQHQSHEKSLGEAYRILGTYDPNDIDGIVSAVKAADPRFRTELYEAEARNPLIGPQKALDRVRERLEPLREWQEKQKLIRQQEQDASREKIANMRNETLQRHYERMEASQRARSEKDYDKEVLAYANNANKNIKEAKNNIKADQEELATLDTLGNKWFGNNKERVDTLKARIKEEQDYVKETEARLRQLDVKLPKAPTPEHEEVGMTFEPDPGYNATEEHGQVMLKAMRAIQEGKDRDAVLKRLRANGILVNYKTNP